jgi:hypothetical protein
MRSYPLIEAALSGASRAYLKLSRLTKEKGVAAAGEKVFHTKEKALQTIPTKKKRNTKRLRKSIENSKKYGLSRQRTAEQAKWKRARLKQSQIDHTIRNYPLIEAVLSGSSRAFLATRRKMGNMAIGDMGTKQYSDLSDKKDSLHSKIPTKRKRNKTRMLKLISRKRSGESKVSTDFIKQHRTWLRKSQIDHTIRNYPLIEAALSGASKAFLKARRKHIENNKKPLRNPLDRKNMAEYEADKKIIKRRNKNLSSYGRNYQLIPSTPERNKFRSGNDKNYWARKNARDKRTFGV